jgi:proteasome lid subunit RPN8/RPN11
VGRVNLASDSRRVLPWILARYLLRPGRRAGVPLGRSAGRSGWGCPGRRIPRKEKKTMSDYDWTIEITPTARAAISREIKAQWDGRELGGALVGYTDGERIVVTDANGVGIGVETPRGETWMRPARGRWADFARACGAELLGDFHTHPGGGSVLPSNADVAVRTTRSARGARAGVRRARRGFLFAPSSASAARYPRCRGDPWQPPWQPPAWRPVHVGAPPRARARSGSGLRPLGCSGVPALPGSHARGRWFDPSRAHWRKRR